MSSPNITPLTKPTELVYNSGMRMTITLEKQDEKAIAAIQKQMGISKSDAIRFSLRLAGRTDFWDKIVEIAQEVRKSLINVQRS
jgi:hypothetical protein